MSTNNGNHRNPTFALGQVVGTPCALELLEQHGMSPSQLLSRHAACDWGDLCLEDKQLNDEALSDGSRILSSYKLGSEKLWIITEAADDCGQRAATTLLLPSEY